MKTLNELREEINNIDSQMRELFEKRMDCAAGVIKYKLAHDLPIFDAVREREILAKCGEVLSNKAYSEYYLEFMRGLMDLSKAYQRKLAKQNSIGYQGAKGAFSHIAASALFPVADMQAYASFEAVFAALDAGDIAFGVLPFENSYAGEVAEVLDLLLAHDCYIVQMYTQKVVHNLVGLQGAALKDITDVYSHQQAILQCQDFLKSHDLAAQPYPNTALAAEYVSLEQCPQKAAIASKETAALYNLEILAENINTSAGNSTKFIVIAKNEAKNGDRLSLIFTVKHDTGQLAKIMAIIAKHNFNMENIRSRPLKHLQWQYYFYVEIHGSLQSEAAQNLMVELRSACEWIKILGNYTLQE
ncbi:MAG: chorismate mutase [Deferribacteraceae bacterium]|jgi:chorismate mutase/prephenate dehydratase|nr:chorismate mutase [Deferribacteraceae bacterium]